jgi:Transposase DDE domain
MRRVRDIEDEVLTRPGRYRQVADNLQVKEVWVGDGERRKRYVLCLNPQEAERERARRAQLLVALDAELALLEQHQEDHPKAACELMASRRYGRYLSEDGRGRPRLDAAKVKAAEKFDGKFVVISNDDTLSAEDIALGYKGGWIIESCFRRMKQTGLQVRPMFHWTPRRIEAHVKLCVLALQMQRAAEISCQLPWARIAHALGGLKAVGYRCGSRAIVQRSKIPPELSAMLKTLKVSVPKQILLVEESPSAAAVG